jgi:chlorite dismutase
MTTEHKPPTHPPAAVAEPLDLSEKGGARNGQPQRLDRRLFMQLQAFGSCDDTQALARALEAAGLEGALYEDVGDPRGVAVLAMSEDPAHFLTKVRPALKSGPFGALTHKPEYSLLGRTYSLGYEPNLEDWLLERPKRLVCDKATPWAVWYPLRRTGAFAQLPRQEQGQILKEHGIIGRTFGDAGFARDIRLNCTGLDKNDNDFVIGLLGKDLHPLSALVEAMRVTKQTSTYIAHMGPFFVGRMAWCSMSACEPSR